MFKLFKKRTKTNEESIFPDAKDVLAETAKVWKYEEILAVIEEKKSKGCRSVFFDNSVISKATAKVLRKKHYSVLRYHHDFEIYWE